MYIFLYLTNTNSEFNSLHDIFVVCVGKKGFGVEIRHLSQTSKVTNK